MFLEDFHTEVDGLVHISAEQGSRFAKEIAGDFNPIHDADNKRFCVPGDLLFALVLGRYGVSERMQFSFKGMVGENVGLRFPSQPGDDFEITDAAGKTFLEVRRSGASTRDAAVVEALVRRYVAFSGHNFPHILVPLMKAQEVMVNPDRPLIVYESMALELQSLALGEVELAVGELSLEVNGKRGDAALSFQISTDGTVVGQGAKKLVMSGLRPYDEDTMQDLIRRYRGWQEAYLSARAEERQQSQAVR